MKIDVQGNSGCVIEIINNHGTNLIHKYTDSVNYSPRLLAQADKQEKARLYIDCPGIKVPRISDTSVVDNRTSVIMDYVYSKNFVSFFELSDVNDIKNFAKTICSFIDSEIAASKLTNIDSSIILKKVESVIENAYKNEFVDQYFINLLDAINLMMDKFCNEHKTIKLPIGVCHGDLTLSNILFNNDEVYLIDFLDSFIETPLQDICKLRQDTKYKWSTLMYNDNYDKTKLMIVYDYIDKYIDSHFKYYTFYDTYYDMLQLVNILRIVPYIKKKEVATFLYNTLETLYNNMK